MESKYQNAEASAASLRAVVKNILSFWPGGYAALVMAVEMVMAQSTELLVVGFLHTRIGITERLAPVEQLMAGLLLGEVGR